MPLVENLALDTPQSMLLLALFCAVFYAAAVLLYRWFGFALALAATFASPACYFILGVSLPGCPRFRSVPFGGCSYSDGVIAINLAFWALVCFSVVCLILRKRPKPLFRQAGSSVR